ncbi:DUF1840 domain-containing protein [Shewanella algidipiscicola]|uniref:DUF1840 domain-containing protein n=1 Tax=Shewanella algidipiscicola TaxID=614070 RepID=A0ABQ4NSU3_9GAMM|nr:DUF1840 domain-containing protein [Shewanella algidipiscicola]GIU02190.1 hypothetical protein TUM4630_33020 [Shewanella algidipiscicola]
MLVTFKTKYYSDITMFGDVATRLLQMMGHSTIVPGAIAAADVPAALQKLSAAISALPTVDEAARTQLDADNEEEEDDAPEVSLRHRALPLIALLESAQESQSYVMWE